MFHNDLGVVDTGHWLWKEEGEIPTLERVVSLNKGWIDDLMNYDALIAYERTKLKRRTG